MLIKSPGLIQLSLLTIQLFVQVGGTAQFLSCPSLGPRLPCVSPPVRSFLSGRVAGLVVEKTVPNYRTAVELALETLNVCHTVFSLLHTHSHHTPLPLSSPKGSQACLRALVVFSAGTLETLTDLFDLYNADRQASRHHTHLT